MSQNLNNFYVLVDTEKNIVIDKIQTLPENWCNISGLPGLSEDELKDLKWAGHHNKGWISIKSENIKKYKSPPENFQLQKNTFKKLISDLRNKKENEPIFFNKIKINIDDKTRYTLFIKRILCENNPQLTFNYKCCGEYYILTSNDIIELTDLIENRIQYLFDTECKIFNQIDNCEQIYDFFDINYTF